MSDADTARSGVAVHQPARPEPSPDEYAVLRQRLSRAVRQVCPGWLANQSEDIVQVAMLRVMNACRDHEGIESLSSSYLWKAAYSATVDEIRARRRKGETSLDDQEEVGEMAVEIPTPEEETRGREIGRGIRDCLTRLVKPRRLAVTLRLQGHSIPEIGSLMKWSEKRSDNLVYRGMAELRNCLTSKGLAR